MRNVNLMAVAGGNLELSFMKGVQEIRMCTKSKMMSGGTLQEILAPLTNPTEEKLSGSRKVFISQTFLQHQISYGIVFIQNQ